MHKTSRAQDSNFLLHMGCAPGCIAHASLSEKRQAYARLFFKVRAQQDQQSQQCRYVPKGLGGFFRSQSISNVREMSWWESILHNDSSTRIVMTPAQVGLSASASQKSITLRFERHVTIAWPGLYLLKTLCLFQLCISDVGTKTCMLLHVSPVPCCRSKRSD